MDRLALDTERTPGTAWDVRSASEDLSAVNGGSPDPDADVSFDGLRRVYAALCAVAHVDGRVTRAQREHLDDYRDYLGLGEIEAEALEDGARRSQELRVGKRPAELELVIPAMIEVAAVGGRVSPDALRLISRVNEKARWPRAKINELIALALERASTASSAASPPAADAPFDESFVARDVTPDNPLGLESSDEGELILLGSRDE